MGTCQASFALRAGVVFGWVVFPTVAAGRLLVITQVSVMSIFLAPVALSGGGLYEVWAQASKFVADNDAAFSQGVESVGAFEGDIYRGVGPGSEGFWSAHPDRDLSEFDIRVIGGDLVGCLIGSGAKVLTNISGDSVNQEPRHL